MAVPEKMGGVDVLLKALNEAEQDKYERNHELKELGWKKLTLQSTVTDKHVIYYIYIYIYFYISLLPCE